MDQEKSEDFVNVAIRIRPNPRYGAEDDCLQIIRGDHPVLHIPDKQQTYSFDNIFAPSSNQLEVYNAMVKPLVKQVIEGFNSTVFAYGQTGTGKTYTMGTDVENYTETDGGLIMRALNDLMVCSFSGKRVQIHISFYEIYNEKVYDLLSKERKPPLPVKGFSVQGLSKNKVETLNDAAVLLSQGCKNRHTGETRQNTNSSRSHAIFTIFCDVSSVGDSEGVEAKLNLVDLAGCESIKKTGTIGTQFHEGVNINKGLLNIGQVIYALSTNQDHVPYRQSTITAILKDSLSKSNYITFIACVRSTFDDLHETVQTLDFAQRAKKVKSRPEMNSRASEQNKIAGAGQRAMGRINATPKSSLKVPLFKTPRSYSAASIHRPIRPLACSSMHENNLPQQQFTPIGESTLHLSPIIMKCIDALETRILDKVANIIARSGVKQTPSRFDSENLQNEVSKIVKRQLMNLPSAASEAIADDTYMDFCTNIPDETVTSSSSPTFKVPAGVTRRKKTKTSSPIAGPVRKSMRLTARLVEPAPVPLRKSTRLKKPRKSLEPIEALEPAKQKPKKRLTSVAKTKAKSQSQEHYVLNILNNGTQADLLKLSTVGVKSAALIIQYRNIKGTFRRIADLEAFPWKGNGFERFTRANFLI